MERIGIIGGNGKMGRWFNQFFSNNGYEVQVSDADTTLSNEELVKSADVIVVSVPISCTAQVTTSIIPFLLREQTVIDICSVRGPAFEVLSAAPCETIGLHPMFSPTIKSLNNQVVIVTEGNPGKFQPTLDSLLLRSGAKVSRCDAKTHDRMMGIIQGLTHFTNIVTAGCLRDLGVSVEDTLPFTSPIYLMRMEMVGRIMAQDPRLYAEIGIVNKETVHVLSKFIESAQSLLSRIKQNDVDGFIKYFEDAASFLGPFKEKALQDSNYLIERLAERENS